MQVTVDSREISPAIHCIEACENRPSMVERLTESDPDWYEAGSDVHVPRNAYLLLGDRTLLFDALSPADTDQVLDHLDRLLDGRPLDFLVVSHPDTPHAANTFAVLDRYPEATLVAPGDDAGHSRHEFYHLEDSRRVDPGDSIDLGAHTVEFREAPFLDAGLSIWMTERTTKTLFCVDWFGFPHLGHDCLRFGDELDRPVTVDQLADFHARVLFWFGYCNVAEVHAEIDRIRDESYEVIAPSHGLVLRESVDDHLENMKEAVVRIRSGEIEVPR